MANPQKASIDQEHIKNTFNLHTMRGRSFFLVLSFLVSLSVVLATAIFYSGNTLEIKNRLVDLDLPTLTITNGIWSATSEALAANKGFLLTHSPKFRQDWLDAWKEAEKHFVELQALSTQLSPEKRRQIDLLERQLASLKAAQRNLSEYVGVEHEKIDKLPPEQAYALQKSLNGYIERTIATDISPAMQGIRTELDILDRSMRSVTNDIIDIERGIANHKNFLIIIVIASSAIAFGFGYYILKALEQSIERPTKLINALADGQVPDDVPDTKDELGSTIAAGNRLKHNLSKASEFALQIGEGNFGMDFKPASENDQLGNALLQMRAKLQEVAENDKKQNWVTEGLAKFGDILRSDNMDFTGLSDKIISNLVKYLLASQGGIFILEDGDKPGLERFLKLEGAYAMGRKKYLDRRVMVTDEFAEGLVGQAYLERQTILLAEVPENYTYVASGIGSAKPKSLLIVPLKMNERVVGVIEIASFHTFEPHHVSFVEKVSETIANTILAIKTNQRTKQLLEDSQMQSEQMRAQEEEMRQNMEELAATQEEMSRKQNQLEKLKKNLEKDVNARTQELTDTLERFDLASKGATEGMWDATLPEDGMLQPDTPVWWSIKLKEMLGYQADEFDENFGELVEALHPDHTERVLKKFFASLKDPEVSSFDEEMQLRRKNGDYVWIRARGTIRRNKEKHPMRFAGVIINIDAQKALTKQQEILANKEQALRQVTSHAPGVLYQYYFDPKTFKHEFLFVSEGVRRIFGVEPEQLIGRSSVSGDVLEIPKEAEEAQQQALLESAKNVAPFVWEGKMRALENEDAEYKYIRIDSTPRQQPDGSLIWDGIMMDISERKGIENEIESLKEALAKSQASKGTSDGAESEMAAYQGMFFKMWHDENRLIERVSGGVAELTGYSPTEFRRQKVGFIGLLHGDKEAMLARINQKVDEALENKQPYILRYKIKRKDGAIRMVMERGKGVANESGELTHIEGFMVDVTDLRPNA